MRKKGRRGARPIESSASQTKSWLVRCVGGADEKTTTAGRTVDACLYAWGAMALAGAGLRLGRRAWRAGLEPACS